MLNEEVRWMTVLRRIAICILYSAFCIPAFGQDSSWTLSTADLQTESVALRGIDAKGVHVVGPASATPRVISHEQFLQIDRSLPPLDRPAKFMLHLVTGDRVGGEPVTVENDRLMWRNASVGELTIPLTQVAALVKTGQPTDT